MVIGLLLPKVLSVESFGYWQYFAFFAGCMELLLFGAGTGLYLKYGGCEYNKINRWLVKKVLYYWLAVDLLIAIVFGTSIPWLFEDTDKQYIFYLLLLGLFVFNLGTFFSYLLQACNRIEDNLHSILVVNFILIACFSGLIFFQVSNYRDYVYVYLLAHVLRDCVLLYHNRSLFTTSRGFDANQKSEAISLFPVFLSGVFLMMADYAIYLLFGIGRLTVESIWGMTTFSKFSFAMSLVLLGVTFVNQIGLVIFPELKRKAADDQKIFFQKVMKDVDVLLFFLPVGYFLGTIILDCWLPAYHDSLWYFGVLIPLCIFEGKMAILINPYYKALRKERLLLLLNMGTLFSGIIMFSLCKYMQTDINAFLAILVILSIGRNHFAEYFLTKMMKFVWPTSMLLRRGIYILLFYVIFSCFEAWNGFGAMLVIFIAFEYKTITRYILKR